EAAVTIECDGRLVSQAMTNILKNACEAISARRATERDVPGRIKITVNVSDTSVEIVDADNGIGLPPEHRHRLTEPYVTTRAKGTGLGLPIVRKVVEDHGGELTLADARDVDDGASS